MRLYTYILNKREHRYAYFKFLTLACLVFFECGIGRIDKKGNWQMVSGMYRVAKSYSKPKVVKKKVDRLTGKEVELYVSKIRLSQGKLEVCASLEEYEREMEKMKDRGEIVSASTLNVGQEIIGNVVDVRPYGVIVDVGANRNGLLHIQAVADLYGKFINKEDGLMEAGLVSYFILMPERIELCNVMNCVSQM